MLCYRVMPGSFLAQTLPCQRQRSPSLWISQLRIHEKMHLEQAEEITTRQQDFL